MMSFPFASQWKKRALGLYGSLLVFSEVGAEDAVKEDDKTTEELEIPRSAQVVIHSVRTQRFLQKCHKSQS